MKRLGQIQEYMLRDIMEDPEEEDVRSGEGPGKLSILSKLCLLYPRPLKIITFVLTTD